MPSTMNPNSLISTATEPMLNMNIRGMPSMLTEQRREEDRLIVAFLEWLLPKSSGDRLARSHHQQDEGRRCRFDDFWALFKADGSLEWPDFEQFVRWESKFAGNARKLFDLLDDTGCGRISARTVLQARREFERSTDVRHNNLEDLKKILVHLHGNLGRAWRKQFDPEQTGKCCQTVFVKACRAVGYQGDLRSTWAELTHGEIHRNATLKDLDPWVDELGVRFVQTLKKYHNSARDGWFASLKAYGSHGRMNLKEFLAMGARFGFNDKDMKRLFNCLDANQDRRVSMSEWMFLEMWESRPDDTPADARATSPDVGSARKSPAAAEMRASESEASLGKISGRRQLGGGDARESLAEFVVVLTKEEYEEYQARLKRRLSAAPKPGRAGSSLSLARRTRAVSMASHYSISAWSGLGLEE